MRKKNSLTTFIVAGIAAGLAWTLVHRTKFTGQVTLFFPGVQSQMFASLAKALRAAPGDNLSSPEGTGGGQEVAPIAATILQSRAAAEYALKNSGAKRRVDSDSLDEFGKTLKVGLRDSTTVTIQQISSSSEGARQAVQCLLDYYKDFITKNRLSRLSRAREATEARLVKVATYLRSLEEKMTKSSSKELRSLGDAAIKASPQVMSQVWMRRMEEEGRAGQLLERLQRVRSAAGKAKVAESNWTKEWARGLKSTPKTSSALNRTVGRRELLEQARLEREYDEALLKHRSLVLQQSFLLTLEDLDNFDYEVIDPISVHPRPKAWLFNAILGAILGCVAGLIHRILWTRRRD